MSDNNLYLQYVDEICEQLNQKSSKHKTKLGNILIILKMNI